ncbi:hypothetical protein [Allorhodopirellula solitaria]|uniref:Uncharacterized protein n=1 Tax=Allorhodopirellula solitaria TaxID=2527987 RepID=A0A5C5YHM9_9BACT|nr:hypothetical protein [Allorhodopirellula solitaria]TWT73062.1 hypothetical protein CA85_15280 [Allorhodopirellula solitaria]
MNASTNASTNASIDIEGVVGRVLAQLRQQAAGKDSESPTSQTAPGTHVISGGVCSLDDIAAINASTNCVEVSARTVVTPAARDELRQRGIALTRVDAGTTAGAEVTQAKFLPGSRAVHLQRDGSVPDQLLAAVKKQAISRGVRLCNQSSLAVILSSRPAITAHQHTGSDRCVVAINRLDDIPRFLSDLSPNTFVLDTAHLHLVALAGAIAAIARPNSGASRVNPKITVAGGLS